MSKNTKTILLTCCGGSPVPYLAKTMRDKYRIVLANADDQRMLADHLELPFELLPFGDDPEYIPALKKLVKRWNIDYIVPGADEELVAVAAAHEKGTLPTPVMPSLRFATWALHKKNILKDLRDIGAGHLEAFETKDAVTYPAIVKPIYGRGSRSVHVVRNAKELNGYFELYHKIFTDVVVEPHIEGEEYTVSVIVNDRNKLIGIVPKHVIAKRGITRSAITGKNTMIEDACKKIVAAMKPSGPFNVQLKLWKNNVYIFEINPRLSTTAVLTDQSFGNEIELYIKYEGKNKIDNAPRLKEGMRLNRYDLDCFQNKKEIACI